MNYLLDSEDFTIKKEFIIVSDLEFRINIVIVTGPTTTRLEFNDDVT